MNNPFFAVNGEKQWINCRNLTKDEIAKWLNLIKSQSGDKTGFRIRKLIHTDHPSIQGPWTPYTFKNPEENLVKYPNPELSQPKILEKTATQELLDIFNKSHDKN